MISNIISMTSPTPLRLSIFFLLSILASKTGAFSQSKVVISAQRQHRYNTFTRVLKLDARGYGDDEKNGNEEIRRETIEGARQRFEFLLSSQKNDSNPIGKEKEFLIYSHRLKSSTLNPNKADIINTMISFLHSNLIPPPPLTTILRERRLSEITLISSLQTSDDSVNELWSLWISERGPTAATILLETEDLVSKGESYWSQAEELLCDIIYEHGTHWPEPINRLATLMYLQGRLEESKSLCEIVLEHKPWHFGALSGMVLVCSSLKEVTAARMWAGKRLPPIGSDSAGHSRRVWVKNATRDAEIKLEKADEIRRGKDIGVKEVEFRNMRGQMKENDTYWQ